MKKVLWLIVYLMTMAFTSCSSDGLKDKFHLDIDEVSMSLTVNGYENVLDALTHIENYYYFHSKYDLKEISFLKTKIHICNDSIVFGEFYVRGKNSFDGGSCQNRTFIFYKSNNGKYYHEMDSEELVSLVLRMDLEDNERSKNDIMKRVAIKHGYLNCETDYDNLKRTHKPTKTYDKKWSREYFDKELGIN